MKCSYPSYYTKFHCLAANCPDSCCKDWAVQIDSESVARYRTLDGPLGDALRTALTEADSDMILSLSDQGRCPMWQENGLCRIHCELGEDWLCQTCREFPRLRHDYGSFVELGLELSCPEAARMILSSFPPKRITESIPGGEAPDYDTATMDILLRTRVAVQNFLQNTSLSTGEALAVVLLYGHAVQYELDGGEAAVLCPDEALSTAHRIAEVGAEQALIAYFQDLEILTPQWRSALERPNESPWQPNHIALAAYFIDRYWLQAISDGDLIGRVKLCVISCLITKLLGGDLLHTAQLYSKEIENNIDNIYAILDGAYTCAAMTDIHLLGMLLKAE